MSQWQSNSERMNTVLITVFLTLLLQAANVLGALLCHTTFGVHDKVKSDMAILFCYLSIYSSLILLFTLFRATHEFFWQKEGDEHSEWDKMLDWTDWSMIASSGGLFLTMNVWMVLLFF